MLYNFIFHSFPKWTEEAGPADLRPAAYTSFSTNLTITAFNCWLLCTILESGNSKITKTWLHAPGSRLRAGVPAILDVPETETEPRRWLQSKRSTVRSSYESWREIWFFFLQSLSRGEEQERGRKGRVSLMNRAEMSQPPIYCMALGKPLPRIPNLLQRVNSSVCFLCKICQILFCYCF